jgi:hypothetical protein
MYGPKPVPFNDACAVASMDMSTEYEVTVFTSEGTKGAKRFKFKLAGLAPAGRLGLCCRSRFRRLLLGRLY